MVIIISKKVIIIWFQLIYNKCVMHNREVLKKTVKGIILPAALLVYILDRVLPAENQPIRIFILIVSISLYSALVLVIFFKNFKRTESEKNTARESSGTVTFPVRNHEQNDVFQKDELQELIPLEDEHDFGELIEVEDPEPVKQVHTSALEEKSVTIDFYRPSEPVDSPETLEELEGVEDSVEELEAVDE